MKPPKDESLEDQFSNYLSDLRGTNWFSVKPKELEKIALDHCRTVIMDRNSNLINTLSEIIEVKAVKKCLNNLIAELQAENGKLLLEGEG